MGAKSKKKLKCNCPHCKTKLVIKTDNLNIANNLKCDEYGGYFSKDKSEWHKSWLSVFPEKFRNMALTLHLTEDEYLESISHSRFPSLIYGMPKARLMAITHTADICINGYVVEFCHEAISAEEFNERCWFFSKLGYKVVWIFDLRTADIEWFETSDAITKWKNNVSISFLEDFIPQSTWNLNRYTVLFQVAGYHDTLNLSDDDFCSEEAEKMKDYFCEMERLTWAIKERGNKSNYSEFVTSKTPSYCINSFVKALKTKEI